MSLNSLHVLLPVQWPAARIFCHLPSSISVECVSRKFVRCPPSWELTEIHPHSQLVRNTYFFTALKYPKIWSLFCAFQDKWRNLILFSQPTIKGGRGKERDDLRKLAVTGQRHSSFGHRAKRRVSTNCAHQGSLRKHASASVSQIE